MLSEADRLLLLSLARGAVEERVAGRAAPAPGASAVLARMAGVFVSLHSRGRLRGCIGRVESDQPLARAVRSCAVAAASADPRFPPVLPDELADIVIELSVLGPFEPVGSRADIDIGRHGLMLEKGWQRGLLLPQVAIEWKWDVETFIVETCRKAGLAPDAWTRGATLWRFEAEVFGESTARGVDTPPARRTAI